VRTREAESIGRGWSSYEREATSEDIHLSMQLYLCRPSPALASQSGSGYDAQQRASLPANTQLYPEVAEKGNRL
jgi:hypothetical protein